MRKSAVIVSVIVLCILSASLGFMLSPGSDFGEQADYYSPVREGGLYDSAPVPAPAGKGAAETFSSALASTAEQKLIQRASLSIEVADFQTSSDALSQIVARAGGFISDSYTYVTDTDRKRGEITIRVPSDRFLAVITELETLGTVSSQHIAGEDVTEEYIDLQARLNNSERQEQRLREILELAETVEEILEVERELERVRGEIEQMTGRITYLENRIELATITVSLYEPEPITQSWGIRDALRAAFAGFVAVIRGLIIAVGYAVPILILLGLGWLIRSVMVRRKSGGGA
ncbi:MAG: DUF4349 domain-containing protein [Methanomicrobia archaeon]|nr:DUF4349 domain-containing protein [Methanomicrobia archaeon]